MDRRAFLKSSALFSLVGTLPSCATNPVTGEQDLMLLNEDEEAELSAEAMTTMVRLALNRLVGSQDPAEADSLGGNESTVNDEASPNAPSFPTINKGATLGEGAAPTLGQGSMNASMEDILEKQANEIAQQVESEMDGILSEAPDYVALL